MRRFQPDARDPGRGACGALGSNVSGPLAFHLGDALSFNLKTPIGLEWHAARLLRS